MELHDFQTHSYTGLKSLLYIIMLFFNMIPLNIEYNTKSLTNIGCYKMYNFTEHAILYKGTGQVESLHQQC